MDLADLRAFARVAELGSFSRAAEQLGLPRGRASDAVRRLEQRWGVRLFQRTTRRVRLTAEGELALARAQPLLAEADGLQSLFQPAGRGLSGRLRVDAPHALARTVLIPRLGEFLAQHPQIDLALSTSDRLVDLVDEGFDLVLRVGPLADSGLVARPLGQLPMRNAASPAYLRRHGLPREPADLDRHRLVHYGHALRAADAAFEWEERGRVHARPMAAALSVNGTAAYEAACLAGLGLVQAPSIGLAPHFATGDLVELLPAHRAPPLPVHLLQPHRRQVPARVKAFADWLAPLISAACAGA